MSQEQPQMSEEDVARIAEERAERLSDEARPEGAEVDNSQREFDPTKGMFTDSPGYDEAPAPFPDPAEEDLSST